MSRDIAPMIFQVRSSRARAFQSIFSSFSVFRACSAFFLGVFFGFFFSFLAMAAKIIIYLVRLLPILKVRDTRYVIHESLKIGQSLRIAHPVARTQYAV